MSNTNTNINFYNPKYEEYSYDFSNYFLTRYKQPIIIYEYREGGTKYTALNKSISQLSPNTRALREPYIQNIKYLKVYIKYSNETAIISPNHIVTVDLTDGLDFNGYFTGSSSVQCIEWYTIPNGYVNTFYASIAVSLSGYFMHIYFLGYYRNDSGTFYDHNNCNNYIYKVEAYF